MIRALPLVGALAIIAGSSLGVGFAPTSQTTVSWDGDGIVSPPACRQMVRGRYLRSVEGSIEPGGNLGVWLGCLSPADDVIALVCSPLGLQDVRLVPGDERTPSALQGGICRWVAPRSAGPTEEHDPGATLAVRVEVLCTGRCR